MESSLPSAHLRPLGECSARQKRDGSGDILLDTLSPMHSDDGYDGRMQRRNRGEREERKEEKRDDTAASSGIDTTAHTITRIEMRGVEEGEERRLRLV